MWDKELGTRIFPCRVLTSLGLLPPLSQLQYKLEMDCELTGQQLETNERISYLLPPWRSASS